MTAERILIDHLGKKMSEEERKLTEETGVYADWNIDQNYRYGGEKVEILESAEEDIMKILTCYSASYYGARGGRKKENNTGDTVS